MALDRYRHLFERAPLCVHEIDAEGRLTAMNPAGLALVNLQSEYDIRGRHYLDFVAPDDRDRIRDLMADALAGATPDYEFVGSGQSPHPRHFTSCFVPCMDAQGRVDRLIGITREWH